MNARLMAERIFVIMRREFKVKTSYRLNATLGVISALSGLLSYGFLGNTAVVSATTQGYGMSLISFLVSGVAFSTIVNNGLSMFDLYARPSQIEEVMASPTDFREYLLISSFLSMLISLGSAALFFTTSIVLFGLAYSYNLPALCAVILLGITSSVGLGFLGVGFQLVFKQTYILSWFLYSVTSLFGNMVVPVQILPGALQVISYLTPQYYFFTGIRVALGSDAGSLSLLLASFAVYSIVLLVAGLFILQWGLSYVRRNSTHLWI